MYENQLIAVVVPAYNEEVLIRPTLETIPEYIDVIYAVDDGSTDATLEVMKEIASNDSRIKIIKHGQNKGVGAAITTGYKQCVKDQIEIAVVMAGDNQMPPEYVPDLLDPIINNVADYAKANRFISPEFQTGKTEGLTTWRLIGNLVLSFLTKISTGYWYIMDSQNGYSAISLNALKSINLDKIYPKYGYCNDLLAKLNVSNIIVIDVPIFPTYGEEKSKIKYIPYISRVSQLLLRNFIWRIKTKYLILEFHPFVFLYLSSLVLVPLGIGLFIFSLSYLFIIGNLLLFQTGLSLILVFLGFLGLYLAMIFELKYNSGLNISNEASKT